MKVKSIDDTIGPVSTLVDRMAERFHTDREDVQSRISEAHDKKIVKILPLFITLCIIIWAVCLVYMEDTSIANVLEVLCLVFIMAFAAIGVPYMRLMDPGIFPKYFIVLFAAMISFLIWLEGDVTGNMIYNDLWLSIANTLGFHLDKYVAMALGYGLTFIVMLFTTVGVLTVVMACLRVYLMQVFKTMRRHIKKGKRGKAENFFMIPDIIDVKQLVIEPKIDLKHYNSGAAIYLSVYMTLMGVILSSYLFVNPFFLQAMDWQPMVSIMLLLSMFVPALIIPWQVVRELNARVISDAPRDYYLWTGAKKRLVTTFMALGAFMMMFLLSLYFGHDLLGIIRNYVLYIIPLLITTLMYAFVYANNFLDSFKMTVTAKYYEFIRDEAEQEQTETGDGEAE